MGATRESIPVGGVWLLSEGNDILVLIERDGVWYEAIREPFYGQDEGGIISHNITASGIEAMNQPVAWLNDPV